MKFIHLKVLNEAFDTISGTVMWNSGTELYKSGSESKLPS